MYCCLYWNNTLHLFRFFLLIVRDVVFVFSLLFFGGIGIRQTIWALLLKQNVPFPFSREKTGLKSLSDTFCILNKCLKKSGYYFYNMINAINTIVSLKLKHLYQYAVYHLYLLWSLSKKKKLLCLFFLLLFIHYYKWAAFYCCHFWEKTAISWINFAWLYIIDCLTTFISLNYKL